MPDAPADLASDAKAILAGIHASNLTGWARQSAWQGQTDAQRRLSVELGRRNGWTKYRGSGSGLGDGPQRKCAGHLFGRRPRRSHEQTMPYADHSGYYTAGGRVVAIVEQPYLDFPEGAQRRQEILAWCERHGVAMHTPDYPSWWYPGRTTLILITLPETTVNAGG